ncbi:hypothetical protein KM043_009177 [Ampulex compressa]|nr:hypothetical protein KM043_009177 [Ampulex compressa]
MKNVDTPICDTNLGFCTSNDWMLADLEITIRPWNRLEYYLNEGTKTRPAAKSVERRRDGINPVDPEESSAALRGRKTERKSRDEKRGYTSSRWYEGDED